MEQFKDNLLGQILGFHNFHLQFYDSTAVLIGEQKIGLYIGICLLFPVRFGVICQSPKSLHWII